MSTVVRQVQRLKPETTVVSLTLVQRALWQTGLPVLDARAVAGYKKRAKLGMLWRAILSPLLGMAALIAFECIGRHRGRVAVVAGAAILLASLFGWLMNTFDLQWSRMDYPTYHGVHGVPSHVSAAADSLLSYGISQEQIGVEYLKSDPILFVEDAGQFPAQRYDLIIW